MTSPEQAQPSAGKQSSSRRSKQDSSSATRITTAGLAIALTLGLGGAVAARAAEEVRADSNGDVPNGAGASTIAGAVDDSALAAVRVQIRQEERARFDQRADALRKKYQQSLDKLAAEYSSRLGGGSSSSGGSSSGGGSYSSGSSSSSGSSGSYQASRPSSGGSGGSGSSSGGGGTASRPAPAPAPQAPSSSKGS